MADGSSDTQAAVGTRVPGPAPLPSCAADTLHRVLLKCNYLMAWTPGMAPLRPRFLLRDRDVKFTRAFR